MTARDRDTLVKLCRQRERLAKTATAHRAAELRADFEAKLAAEYSYDSDEIWARARALADEAVEEAGKIVATRCQELGIPAAFAPGLFLLWHRRGENAVKERRTELRKVANTRIDALEREARFVIEKASLQVQTALLADGLETDAARQFLDSMPGAEALMPPLSMQQIEAAAPVAKAAGA
jgi:hypothetical protein